MSITWSWGEKQSSCGAQPKFIVRINSSIVTAASTIPRDSPDPRSELDRHANMLVFVKNCFVFESLHGRTVDVAPFDPSLGLSKKIPIVDAAVAY